MDAPRLITQFDISTIRNNFHGRSHNNDYNEGNLGFGYIHYAMIRNLRPRHVSCVGSQRGYVPAICALACMHNRYGKVDFVDAGYTDGDPKAWGGVGIWKKSKFPDYWKPLGVQDYIETHVQTIENYIAKSARRYEYIYVDADHSYEGVKSEYKMLWRYLDAGGLMVFHDVAVDKETVSGKCGVKRFWQELPDANKTTIFRSAGLGILQRK